MNIDQQFLNSFVTVLNLFFTTYLTYGLIKRKPLIGNYKPGTPNYDLFQKFVNSKWYPVLTVATVLFSAIDLVAISYTLINGPYPKALLAVAPVMAFAVFLFVLWLVRVAGERRKTKE